MNIKRLLLLTGTVLLGILLVSMWFVFLSGPPVLTRAASYTVCEAGQPTCDYSSIQSAVDAASNGDVIKVAEGTYTGINNQGGLAQVVYLDKSVTIRGGYTHSFSEPSDPVANPSTLDAQGGGRVLYITGNISPTIEGLRITGGDATGFGGGGGVQIDDAMVTLINNQVFGNKAWDGGGLRLDNSDTTLINNSITSNTVDNAGGGIFLSHSPANLNGNTISANHADGGGGGMWVDFSAATLSHNHIISNTGGGPGGISLTESDNAMLIGNTISNNTSIGAMKSGGGIGIFDSDNVTISSNTISNNSADWGGGMDIHGNNTTLIGNSIISNTADSSGGGLNLTGNATTLINNTIISNTSGGGGGGIFIFDGNNAILTGNTVAYNDSEEISLGGDNITVNRNIISHNSAEWGGGLCLSGNRTTITGNIIFSNTVGGAGGGLAIHDASGTQTITGNFFSGNSAIVEGGGIYLGGGMPILTNNIIVDNHTDGSGSAIDLTGGASLSRLTHNTIARNRGGNGSGIHIYSGTVVLTNTIIVSHTLGISVQGDASASLDSTMWGTGTWANGIDWDGTGTVNTTNDYRGNPDFVEYEAGDYHIGSNSDAIDVGIDAGVTSDIENQPRPYQAPDIGADEYWPPGVLKYIYLPLVTR